MYKKVIAGFLVFATSTVFGMNLEELNSVSKEALMEINGIGEAKATAIINEREKVSSNHLKIFKELKISASRQQQM